jgi:hypothetical protein
MPRLLRLLVLHCRRQWKSSSCLIPIKLQKLPSNSSFPGKDSLSHALPPPESWATMTTLLLQTPLAAVTRTRAGMWRASDGGGWRMLSIALLIICVKTIIIMLYPHLLAAIPITFQHPTLALPTPAPVEFTSRPPHPWPISIPRLPPSESKWQTASQRGLLLAQPLLLSHPSHLQRCRDM